MVDLLSVTGNVFGVHNVDPSHPYQFKGDELGPNVLQKTGGSYPYTNHVGFGASGVVSLTLPELPAFQVGTPTRSTSTIRRRSSSAPAWTSASRTATSRISPGPASPSRAGSRERSAWAAASRSTSRATSAFQANFLGANVIGGDAELIISYNPHNLRNSGLGACFGLSAGRSRASVGIAYHWGDSYFDLPDDLKLGGCDNNWLDSQIGVNVQTASVGAPQPRRPWWLACRAD